MGQYKVCPKCGAHLDHGETCNCKGATGFNRASKQIRKPIDESADFRRKQEARLLDYRPRLRPENMRHETCRECGRVWNMSKDTKLPESGYICPHCYGNRKRSKAQ